MWWIYSEVPGKGKWWKHLFWHCTDRFFKFVSVSCHNIVHVVSNKTPGVANVWQKILKIIKGRLQQSGQGTNAETAISECSDAVNLVLSRCEWVPHNNIQFIIDFENNQEISFLDVWRFNVVFFITFYVLLNVFQVLRVNKALLLLLLLFLGSKLNVCTCRLIRN